MIVLYQLNTDQATPIIMVVTTMDPLAYRHRYSPYDVVIARNAIGPNVDSRISLDVAIWRVCFETRPESEKKFNTIRYILFEIIVFIRII